MSQIASKPAPGESVPKAAQSPLLTTLTRGLAILEFVARSKRFVRLRDVAEEFDMDRSAALRFLRTLESEGFVVRHEAMKMYSLGPKLLTLPRIPANAERIVEIAQSSLARLSKTTGQLSHLATLAGNRAVLVEVVASDAPILVKQAVGDLEPLHTSAVGKAIFAFLPKSERAALGKKIVFEKHTEHTILSMEGLEQECEAIRRSSVAFDRQEGDNRVSCLACPILDDKGVAVASIGLSYVQALLPGPVDGMKDHIELVLSAAQEIGRALR